MINFKVVAWRREKKENEKKKYGQEGQKKDPPWQSNPYSHLDMLHDLIVVLPNHREASSVATAPLLMPLGSLLIIHC
jgi:hypothetical protein